MNRKIKIIFITISVIFILLFLLFVISINNNNDNNYKEIKNKIFDEIDKKENMLLYLTDNSKNCLECEAGDNLVKFYQKIYNIEFIIFDKSQNSNEDYNKVLKKIGLSDSDIQIPAVIFIKKGSTISYVNGIGINQLLKQYMLENSFIDNKTYSIDTQIEDTEYYQLLKKQENNLMLWCYMGRDCFKYREKVFNIATKYNIQYNVLYNGIGDTQKSSVDITKKIKIDSDTPLLLIVNNNKIIDYTSSNDEAAIKKFLKKNTIIK